MSASPDTHPGRYDFAAIERKWQKHWEQSKTFKIGNPRSPGFDANRPKRYILDMFPYPSGAGLHVGHPLGYCATDIYSRYSRMKGFNVLHPMGYDAFGLPAEQFAIDSGVHPAVTTQRNIDNMRRQLKMFGFSYDWDREMATCTPDYYKYTQWIFLQMYESWFDESCVWTDAEGHRTQGRAQPIRELEAALSQGVLAVNDALEVVRSPDDDATRPWTTLTDDEKQRALDQRRLAYLAEVPVNWCPALGTVLANEEVTNDGRSDRGNHPVYRRPLRQWMLRITSYAERLLHDLVFVDWPEPIKLMQRNWIGRSTGAEVDFPIASGAPSAPVVGEFAAWQRQRASGGFPAIPEAFVIRVYTTRPDTLFGATYMVLAPEHPLVERLTTDAQRAAVEAYVEQARNRSDLDRTADTKEKTGVFTGATAVNPVNGEEIPIWVADYVLMGYGTGAIMAVPAHDTRDLEFAKAFDLPIVAVVMPDAEWMSAQTGGSDAAHEQAYRTNPGQFEEAFVGEGTAVNSGMYNKLLTPAFNARITADLEKDGQGRGAVKYKLRDWIFTRQRYWGEPFPILHSSNGETRAIDASTLPLELPAIENYRPSVCDDATVLPEPPLGRATDWKTVTVDGVSYARDLNTMPQWAGSCWYYLRFIDPSNVERFCDADAERYWMPVDTYVGGAEHAVLHLLYARFWHKVLHDLDHVSTAEPFKNLINQGMIQSFAYRDDRGVNVPMEQVEETEDGTFVEQGTDHKVTQIVAKMSKALKNVVNPDEIIVEFGADTFRCYEMFMGPLESSKPWNTRDVPGVFKLLNRIWRLVIDPDTGKLSTTLTDDPADDSTLRVLHKTIKKVGEDIEAFKFNTAIGQIFEFVNVLTPMARRPRSVIEPFLLAVAPFAPHIAEELWSRLGHAESLAYAPWPAYDERLAKDEQVEMAVQIQGKVRARIMVSADADEASLQEAALADERVQQALAGKTVRKIVVVKGRLVNIVVG